MRNWWAEELWRLISIVTIGWLLGVLFGFPKIGLWVALFGYVAYLLRQLVRVNRWLENPEVYEIPDEFGLWGAVYAKISRYKKRCEKREQQLLNSVAQYQAPAMALPDAAVAIGTDGEIRWFNQEAERLLGLVPEKDIGQTFVNLFRSPELTAYLRKKDFSQDLQITKPGTFDRKLLIRVAGYGFDQMVLLAQDISARIRAEQSRRDFVANVSHELRTPLTVVNGYVENLIDSGEVPEKWERPIQLMEQQVLRMRHIIEDLLTLAKLDGAEPEVQEPINISGLCERVAAEARSMTTHHEIKVACLTEAQLIGDGKQIYSALSNLVTNAIKYSGDDTLITIAWQMLPRGLSLSVTDSGDGIARQHLSRLTERFYRVDTARSREKGGTGLGLAIVNSIIDQHGGKLEVDSEVGKGSQFSCIFPKSLAVYEPNLKITAEG